MFAAEPVAVALDACNVAETVFADIVVAEPINIPDTFKNVRT